MDSNGVHLAIALNILTATCVLLCEIKSNNRSRNSLFCGICSNKIATP
ncbi:hypothetical protein PROPEN_04663 [Proteus penneri ATCC 35198]|nr:hypothetical protein PROPEN_04663 [Proteus penneri ATCC 35198]